MSKVVFYKKGDISLKVVGNCHIGGLEYFNTINNYLTGTVLYEEVKGPKLENPSLKQLADFLDLHFQCDVIRPRDHWINSDLYLTDLLAIDPSISKLVDISRSVETLKKHSVEYPEIKNILLYLIRFMDKFHAITTYRDNYAIVKLRNKKVILDLVETIGKGDKDISILYGLGHLRDLHSNIVSLGFRKVQTKTIPWSSG